MIGRGDAMKDERQRKRVSPKPVSYIRRITFDYFSRILEKRIYWKDWKILIFEQGREKLYTIRVQSPIFSRILEENISERLENFNVRKIWLNKEGKNYSFNPLVPLEIPLNTLYTRFGGRVHRRRKINVPRVEMSYVGDRSRAIRKDLRDAFNRVSLLPPPRTQSRQTLLETRAARTLITKTRPPPRTEENGGSAPPGGVRGGIPGIPPTIERLAFPLFSQQFLLVPARISR